ncbi:hypothetical protein BKA67DRAFT_537445 [Truncatella angustata]|uniref:ATP adenylyltransferase n=1 Tax=Truncatella angustata TaxID=152316 RepID=A0A9P8UG39_9PEZI|nr:uncharacterized protein BKA67DRAFT_537445 [Truncatella angustata]KAH6651579.1 hypothetical protein BKA67DRAFT_537445 [Truncatella angustata]KAH8204167.1 hypothetical protein TruAng_001719 [Truncatella angustata]
MTLPIREEFVLAEFDRRCKAGLIFYDDKPEIHTYTYGDFQFEFAITEAISKKPYLQDNEHEPVTKAKRPPGYAPGSDIDISGYEIGDVSRTHILAFNKYCMYRPHLLLLTKDGYKRQYDHLDLDDMQSAWNALEALNWNYFVFFNCGKDGGCSRLHKHLQLGPYLSDRLAPWPSTSRAPRNIPYEYVLRRFDRSLGPKQLIDIYRKMIGQAKEILGLEATEAHVPHNLMMGKSWMMVIPRRKAHVRGAYSNTLGLFGMVSVANHEELGRWVDQGPLKVVEQLGVPRQPAATD